MFATGAPVSFGDRAPGRADPRPRAARATTVSARSCTRSSRATFSRASKPALAPCLPLHSAPSRLHAAAPARAGISCAAPAWRWPCPLLDAMLPAFARGAAARPPDAAPHARGLQQPRPAAGQVLPHRGRASTTSRRRIWRSSRITASRLHGLQRRLASRCRWRPSGRQLLPHRRAAPGQRRLPQHHLARPVRRRADRPPHAFPVAHARRECAARAAQPLLDRLRRADPVRGKAVRSLQAALPPRHAGGGAGAGAQARARPEHHGRRRRPGRSSGSERRARATASGSTNISPACATWRSAWATRRRGRRSPSPSCTWSRRSDPASPREYMEKVRLMYDMARLAFETDSTRLVTLLLDSVNSPAIEVAGAEITDGYHNLSHHGKSAGQARAARDHRPRAHEAARRRSSPTLKRTSESRRDCCSTARWSSTAATSATRTRTSPRNLPVLLAGGGFSHAGHLAFDRERNYPLPNLFVSMLQRLGIEARALRHQHRHDARAGFGVSFGLVLTGRPAAAR